MFVTGENVLILFLFQTKVFTIFIHSSHFFSVAFRFIFFFFYSPLLFGFQNVPSKQQTYTDIHYSFRSNSFIFSPPLRRHSCRMWTSMYFDSVSVNRVSKTERKECSKGKNCNVLFVTYFCWFRFDSIEISTNTFHRVCTFRNGRRRQRHWEREFLTFFYIEKCIIMLQISKCVHLQLLSFYFSFSIRRQCRLAVDCKMSLW